MIGLGCFHFARHYFGNRFCFLFLRVLRCFSSPRLTLLPMYSAADIPILIGMGSPIQRSPAQSLFSGSPELIAASHVFHHQLAPRHPPFALNSLVILIATYANTFFIYGEIALLSILFSKNQIESPIPFFIIETSRLKAKNNFWLPAVISHLVEVNGIEPMTSCVQGRCSPN